MKTDIVSSATRNSHHVNTFDVLSNVALKLADDISAKKIERALTYICNQLHLDFAAVIPKTNHSSKKIDASTLEQCEFSSISTLDVATDNLDLHTPSNSNYSLLIGHDKKKSNDFSDSFKDINSDWLDQLAEIVLNAVENLKESQQKQHTLKQLNSALNTSDSLYTSWDHKLGWHYHNVNSIVKMGYKKDSIDIQKIHKTNPIHKEDWKNIYPLFERCITKGIPYQYDYRTVSPQGKINWYHNYVKVTDKNVDGSARQFTSISENITHIKKSEQLLTESAEREKWLVKLANDMFNCNDNQSINVILEKLAKYLKADRCAVRIIDPDTLYCNLVAEYASPKLKPISSLFPDIISQTGIGWIGRLLKLGKAYVVEDYPVDVPNKKLVDYHSAIQVRGQVCLPLIHNNELMGYMAVMTCEPRKWKKQDIRIVQVISETLYMAISRNRLLSELRATEARYELTMKSSSHGIWDHDLVKNSLFISPHYFKNLGYNLNEVEPSVKFIESITHPEDKNLLSKESLKLYGNINSALEVEVRQRKKSGEYEWILSRGKVVKRDKQGRPLRMTGINTDISAQKKTLKELEDIRKISVEENKRKSEFLERMSHEIRTPMNAITGMAYLTMETALNTEQYNYIHDIDSAAQSLLRIIDDILDFSKIESGELTIVSRSFNLKDELNRVEKLIALKATQGNNTLEVKISEDIPELVIGDANRLGQILLNLLSNAVKFTSNGTVTLSAQVAEINEKKQTTNVLFSVIDSGIGLEKEQLDTLFDPFVQAQDSTTRHFGGTGLGLSICKNLVEMMGGSIHVISIPKVGTTFHFTIDFGMISVSPEERKYQQNPPNNNLSNLQTTKAIADNEEVSESKNLSAGQSHAATKQHLKDTHALSGKNILLVEDNIINQKVARGILAKYGMLTTEANNGEEALNILKSKDDNYFDAVLMDIEMPVLDGISTTKHIRQKISLRSLPIIAMTAHAMVGDKERCLDAGMNDYIPKPVDPNQLIKTLEQLILDN